MSKTIELLFNGTRHTVPILEAEKLLLRLQRALSGAKKKCPACGGLTLPVDKCRLCGRTL